MKRFNQSGNVATIAIVGVVIVAVAGLVGWRYSEAERNTNKTNNVAETSNATPKETPKVTPKPNSCGMIFETPANFTASIPKGDAGICTFELTSNDYAVSAASIGGKEVTKGAQFSFETSETALTSAKEVLFQKYAKSGSLTERQINSGAANYKEFTINGKSAAQFEMSYEGDSPYIVVFMIADGRYVTAEFDAAGNDDAEAASEYKFIEFLEALKYQAS